MKKITTMLILLLVICACKAEKKMTPFSTLSDDDTVVLIETSSGEIKVKLYNDTPKHRDNFIKNVKNHMYDGIIFHRVVKNFMIQTGDPSARDVPQGAPAGGGDVSWTVPAEIVYPKYFHKYGALAAARENDDVNPQCHRCLLPVFFRRRRNDMVRAGTICISRMYHDPIHAAAVGWQNP